MRSIESYWNDCERLGFIRTEHDGKILYTMPEKMGYGSFEIWGDARVAPVVVMDYTLKEPWAVFESVDERYLQVSQFYSGEVDIYQKRSETLPAEHGLNCFLNYPPVSAYRRIGAGQRVADVGLYFRQPFFESLPFALPDDFWETAASTLNPDVVILPAVTQICNQLRSCELSGDALKLYVQGKVNEAFALLYSYVYANKKAPPVHLSQGDRAAMESVKEILARDLASPPSIAELASQIGVNQQKLMTGFRHLNGMTIYTYLMRLRMQRAAELLRETDMPVVEVARAIGYHGDGHFQSAFKEMYGVTPSKMRRECAAKQRPLH